MPILDLVCCVAAPPGAWASFGGDEIDTALVVLVIALGAALALILIVAAANARRWWIK